MNELNKAISDLKNLAANLEMTSKHVEEKHNQIIMELRKNKIELNNIIHELTEQK